MSEEVLTRKKALFRILPVVIAIVIIILIAVIFSSIKNATPNPTIDGPTEDYLTIGEYKVSKERLYTYLKKDYGASELARMVDTELLSEEIQALRSEDENTTIMNYVYETLFGTTELDEVDEDEIEEAFESLRETLMLYGYLDSSYKNYDSSNDEQKKGFQNAIIEYFVLDAARKEFTKKYLNNLYQSYGIASSSDSAIKEYYDANYTGEVTGIFIPFTSTQQALAMLEAHGVDTCSEALKESSWVKQGFNWNKPESATNVKQFFSAEETIHLFFSIYNEVMANYTNNKTTELLAEKYLCYDNEEEKLDDALVVLHEASEPEVLRSQLFDALNISTSQTSYKMYFPTSIDVVFHDGTVNKAEIQWTFANNSPSGDTDFIKSKVLDGEEVISWGTVDENGYLVVEIDSEKIPVPEPDKTATTKTLKAMPTIVYTVDETEHKWDKADDDDDTVKTYKITLNGEKLGEGIEIYNYATDVYVNSYVSEVKDGFRELTKDEENSILNFVFRTEELCDIDEKLEEYLQNGSTKLVPASENESFTKCFTVNPVESDSYSFLMLKLAEKDDEKLVFDDTQTEAQKALIDEIVEKLSENELETNDVSKILYDLRTVNNLEIYDRYLQAVYGYNYNYFFETTLSETDFLKFVPTEEHSDKVVASFRKGDKTVEITADQLFEQLEKHYGVLVASEIVDDYSILSDKAYNDVYNPYTGEKYDAEAFKEALTNEVGNVQKNFEYGYFTNSELAQYGFIPAFGPDYGWKNFITDYFGAFEDSELLTSSVFGGSIYVDAEELFTDELNSNVNKALELIKKANDKYYSVDVMNLVIFFDEDLDGQADVDSKLWNDEYNELADELSQLFFTLAPYTTGTSFSNQMAELVALYDKAPLGESPEQLDTIKLENNFSKFVGQGLRVKWETSNTYTNNSSIVTEFSDELKSIYDSVVSKGLLDTDLSSPYFVMKEGKVVSFTTEYGRHMIAVTRCNAPTYSLEGINFEDEENEKLKEIKAIIAKRLYIDTIEAKQDDDFDSNASLTDEENEFCTTWFDSVLEKLTDSNALSEALLNKRTALANENKIVFADSKNLEKYKLIIELINHSIEKEEN